MELLLTLGLYIAIAIVGYGVHLECNRNDSIMKEYRKTLKEINGDDSAED